MDRWMTSMGLDIGTSTTKFIVSRLRVRETTQGLRLPGSQIVDREVVYASPIYTTPLTNAYDIDLEALVRLLTDEYEQSGICPEDVQAGAVIITGETARKANADKIIHHLAQRAGDFVVATAGADLEAILAGKGSGALKRSLETHGTIANIDIGGGTANVALFQRGKVIQTFTFHLGGRLIRLDASGEITYVSEYLQAWLQATGLQAGGLQLEVGRTVGYDELTELCQRLSHSMLSYLLRRPNSDGQFLLLGPAPKQLPVLDEVLISGGVGQMMIQAPPRGLEEVAKYGDIGPLLAASLRVVADSYPISVHAALETTRATVIGAGLQNIELSGSTVYASRQHLPLRNIPLLPITVVDEGLVWSGEEFALRLAEVFDLATQLYDARSGAPFALALVNVPYCTYLLLQDLAEAIYQLFAANFPPSSYLIVLSENDMAKALGQALSKRCKDDFKVVCLDQVDFTHGDYIDIGLPVSGEAVFVSIKTLAFA